MKKIPTLFIRDPATNLRTLTKEVHPDCAWVMAGEGRATRKFDGTCVLIRDGQMFRRREVKADRHVPENFELVEVDAGTRKQVGWVPVTNHSDDKWHREIPGQLDGGFYYIYDDAKGGYGDGTWELVGPKINKNPENFKSHQLVCHGAQGVLGVPRTYDLLQEYLSSSPFEGIVWHHEDGRMAKIKRKDFV